MCLRGQIKVQFSQLPSYWCPQIRPMKKSKTKSRCACPAGLFTRLGIQDYPSRYFRLLAISSAVVLDRLRKKYLKSYNKLNL